jgi:acetoacetate decarboxylase
MKPSFLVAALPLVVSGCASTLPEVVDNGSHPDSAYATPVRYQGVMGSYTHRVPVDPKPWRGLNDAQVPAREGA